MTNIEELRMQYPDRVESLTHYYGKPFKTDRNGTLHFASLKCRKCGGAGGADEWQYTGWTCYRCGGSGFDPNPEVIKLYTPEYEVKLEERRAKREAKRIEEHNAKLGEIRAEWLECEGFNADGDTYLILGDTYSKKDAIKADGGYYNSILGWHFPAEVEGYELLKVTKERVLNECYEGYDFSCDRSYIDTIKAEEFAARHPEEHTSEYVGEVGKRLKGLKLTVTFTTTFEGFKHSYWDDGIKYFYSMRDADGNIFTYTTSSELGSAIEGKGWRGIEEGESIILDGTVKSHNEYKGDKQTVLNRCKVARG